MKLNGLSHYHPCKYVKLGCKGKLKCYDAFLMRNYDGWPEVICVLNPEENIECEECLGMPLCEDCGFPENLGHDDICIFWMRYNPFFEGGWWADQIPIEQMEDDYDGIDVENDEMR